MNERTKGILHILLAIIIIALVFAFSNQLEQFKEYGYFGVFIVSAVSAATIFIPAPGWAIVFAMAKFLDPIGLGIAAGVGSAIGEITGYVAGQGASQVIHANKHFKKFKDWIKKNDLVAIFVLAAIPNPIFDVAGIAAGSLNIKWWRFLIATALGRTLRYAALAYFGAFSLQLI
ncbi:DedA family protein [Candidatus Micrarchaeota archaeon]|nr:DedA family protein [Candidatus Micrarchaeota archaeon]